MAGPGGREIGRVSVRVLPDTRAFGQSLEKYLTRMERTLKVEIPAELNESKLVQDARRAAEAAGKASKVPVKTDLEAGPLNAQLTALVRRLSGKEITIGVDFDAGLARARAGFASLGRTVSSLVAPVSLASMIPTLLGLGAAAGTAAGAINLLPAAIGAAAIGIGTLKLAFSGFGEAMKSMGDPAKFAEALKSLAPAAQDVARQIRGLKPAFEELQLDVQQKFFAELGTVIANLGNKYLPLLQDGMSRTASAMGDMARQAGDALMRPESVNAVKVMLDQTAVAFDKLAPAGGAFLAALTRIGEVGSTFLPGMASSVTDLANRFNEWAQAAANTGRLKEIITAALRVFEQLGAIAGNVFSIVSGLFDAIGTSGTSALVAIENLTAGLADFVHSTEGARALGQIFDGIGAAMAGIVPALTKVIRALVVNLGPVMQQLGPAVGQLATQLGDTLVTAIRVLSPLLLTLATFLNENMTWLGPLIIAFGTFAVTAGPVVGIVTRLSNAFAMLSRIGPGLVKAGTAFGTFASKVATTTLQVTMSLGRMVARGIAQVTMFTVRTVAMFVSWTVRILVQVTTMTAQVIARFVMMTARLIAQTVVMTAQVVARFTLMTAQVVARTAVMAAQVTARFVAMTARAVASTVAAAARIVARWAFMAAGAMARAVVMAAAWIVAMGPIGWVIAAVVGLVALIIANWDKVKSWTISAWNATVDFVVGAWRGIVRAVSSGVSNVLGWVRSLPGRILSALGNLGSLLWGAGADLIRGMINGVRSMIGNLLGTVRDMASSAVSTVKSWLGIGSPSKVFRDLGAWTGEGFAKGIERGTPAAIDAASEMARSVAATPVSSPLAPAAAGFGGPGGSLQEAVTAGVIAGLDGAKMRIDGNGVTRLVNRTNAANARR